MRQTEFEDVEEPFWTDSLLLLSIQELQVDIKLLENLLQPLVVVFQHDDHFYLPVHLCSLFILLAFILLLKNSNRQFTARECDNE